MEIPCKECISYAICVNNEDITCSIIQEYLSGRDPLIYGTERWIKVKKVLPKLTGVKDEGGLYKTIEFINNTVWIYPS